MNHVNDVIELLKRSTCADPVSSSSIYLWEQERDKAIALLEGMGGEISDLEQTHQALDIAGVPRCVDGETLGIWRRIALYPIPPTQTAAVPDWEKEAKRAFWTGLEIGAGMGAVAIAPRWDEYIEKRKGEIDE